MLALLVLLSSALAAPAPPLIEPSQVALARSAALATPGFLTLGTASAVAAFTGSSLAGVATPVFFTGAWLSVPIHGWTASRTARSLSMAGHWTSQSLGWCAIGAWMSPLMMLNPDISGRLPDSGATVPAVIVGAWAAGWGLAAGQSALNRRTFRRAGQPLPPLRTRRVQATPVIAPDYVGLAVRL